MSTTFRTALDTSSPVASSADISMAAGTEFGALDSETRVGNLATTGFGVGGTVGAVLGALAVGIAAMATDLVLPGTALYVAGPLSAVLLGAGAGAANGGLVGALIGWGIPVEIHDDDKGSVHKSLRQNVRTVLCPNSK